jgi:REP element-mobilizing transposase RayT
LDRKAFLETLAKTCQKSGWQVHAYCVMRNHFHFVVETPQANLAQGMKWFLGTYTIRFNRRHRLSGHLFAGRYKSLLVDRNKLKGTSAERLEHSPAPYLSEKITFGLSLKKYITRE